MNIETFVTITFSIATVGIGAFFGAVANKILSEKDNSSWIIAYYIIGTIAIILPIVGIALWI